MLKMLWQGLSQIGDGLSSISKAWAGTSRFDDYRAYMPGRPVRVLTPEEAMRADQDALRQDWQNLGQYWPKLEGRCKNGSRKHKI